MTGGEDEVRAPRELQPVYWHDSRVQPMVSRWGDLRGRGAYYAAVSADENLFVTLLGRGNRRLTLGSDSTSLPLQTESIAELIKSVGCQNSGRPRPAPPI